MIDKKLIYLAIIIDAFAGLFWQQLPKGSYYILNALLLLVLAICIFKTDKKSFIGFILLALSLSNLLDELFFEPTKICLNEFVLIISLPIIWFLKFRNK